MNFYQNWTTFITILRREVTRFMRIWTQTLLPPVITQSLYFIIFGGFIGSQIQDINKIPYMAYIVPGLVMMSIINSSFSNVVSSFFGSKFQKNIEELMVSPTANITIILGYSMGGVLRGLLVGLIVAIIAGIFTQPEIHSYLIIFLFAFLTALVFSLGGLLNAIFANKFDDVSIIPTFVLTPLTYLGGVFYSINSLPQFWQNVSKLNPILYMVDGFRYGFYGKADFNIITSLSALTFFALLLTLINLYILRKGLGLKS